MYRMYGIPRAHGCAGAVNGQDVRYTASAWMRRSGEAHGCAGAVNGQDVRYGAGARKHRSDDVENVRYAAGT